MDIITLGLGVGTIAMIPLGAVTKAVIAYGPRLTVLETNYANMSKTLDELREEQKAQTRKLDSLIERFL